MIFGATLMKSKKVAAVISRQNPAFGHRERQDLSVWHGSIGFPCFQ